MIGRIFLASIPFLCFFLQLYLSFKNNTHREFYNHKIVFYADWALLPANYYAYLLIKKASGFKIFWLMFVAVALTMLFHSFWQYNHMDSGYMIDKNMIVLPAGWVHIFFMTIEMGIIFLVFFTPIKLSLDKDCFKACSFIALYFLLNYICSFDYVNAIPLFFMTIFIIKAIIIKNRQVFKEISK